MRDWKNICKKLIFPPVWMMIASAIISAVSLAAVFMKGADTNPIAYIVYVFSFYSLTVICIACYSVLPGYWHNIHRRVYDSKYGNMYMTDLTFKTNVSLYSSLTINLMYAAVNLFSGIMTGSVWYITLAAYYIILAVMRFLLVRFVRQSGIGKDRVRELRRSRLCGIILITLNLALSGVVVLVIKKNEGFVYNGILIYVMAMYTFYITAVATVNIFKYRKYNSPIMSAATSIRLAAALVSVLALETAMLTRFGSENTHPGFNQLTVGLTGAGVCVIVVLISVYMIARANRELAEFKKSQT